MGNKKRITLSILIVVAIIAEIAYVILLLNYFSHIKIYGPEITKHGLDSHGIEFQTHNINKYKSLLKDFDVNKNFMPKLNSLGNYQDLIFTSNHQTVLIFCNDSYILSLKYNDKEYSRQKQKIKRLYIFEKNPITFYGLDDVKYKIPIDFTMKDGTHYRYVKLNEDDFTGIPHEIMLIGENDKTHKIYYIFFYDTDLDFYESNEDLFGMIGPFK